LHPNTEITSELLFAAPRRLRGSGLPEVLGPHFIHQTKFSDERDYLILLI